MVGSRVFRACSLLGLSLLALSLPAPGAMAGSDGQDDPSIYDESYSGPPIIRRIPGLRLLFGDKTPEQTGSDSSGSGQKKKKAFDDSYYEPEPAPAKPKAVTAPASPAAAQPRSTNLALPQKTATAAPAKPLAAGPLSCEQATAVVSGFGFASVEAASCSGKLYAFNAKRGGKNFAIKLNPASGELTEVKKLP